MITSKFKKSTVPADDSKFRKTAVGLKLDPSGRKRAVKNSTAAPQVTTIRLDAAVQEGLRMIEAHSGMRRPLNKWVNIALAEFIERQTASITDELEQALRNIKAYRKTDPGYKRAIRAFIDSELAFAAQDPMEGARKPQASGPAVSVVREILRG